MEIELEDFLKEAMDQIEKGVDVEQRNIDGPISFEVSIAKTIKTEGGIKFYVFKGEHDREKEHVAKISLKVYPKESERAKAAIQEAIRHNQEEAEKWRGW